MGQFPGLPIAIFFSPKEQSFPDIHCVKSVQIQSFFWSVCSCIQTEYGETGSISPYSVQVQENTDQKKLLIWTLFTQCAGLTLLCIKWVHRDPSTIFLVITFTQQIPESSDSMYSSILMLEKI